jgi:hypothetical protein
MRCSKRPERRGGLHALLAAGWLALAGAAHAAGIELRDFAFGAGDDAYELAVSAEFTLPPALENLLEKGVTLTFRAEVEVQRPRWWWFNERVARKVSNYRLSYHALTRQYRVTSGEFQQSFPALSDALRKITRLRQWPVVERAEVRAGAQYEAVFRYYHDVSQLPKPLQVTAFANTDWELSAEPRKWTFTAGGK